MKKILREKEYAEYALNTDWDNPDETLQTVMWWVYACARYLGKQGLKPKKIREEIVKNRLEKTWWYNPLSVNAMLHPYINWKNNPNAGYDANYKVVDKMLNKGYKDRKKEYVEVYQIQIPKAVIKWFAEVKIIEDSKENEKAIKILFANYWLARIQAEYSRCWWCTDLNLKEYKKYTDIKSLTNKDLHKFLYKLNHSLDNSNNQDTKWFRLSTDDDFSDNVKWSTFKICDADDPNKGFSGYLMGNHWTKHLFGKFTSGQYNSLYNLIHLPEFEDVGDNYIIEYKDFNNCSEWFKNKIDEYKATTNGGFVCDRCKKLIPYKSKKSNRAKYCDECKRIIKNQQKLESKHRSKNKISEQSNSIEI